MLAMIESNPQILGGKPVVAGTRISVEMLLDALGAGETIDDLVDQHPRLTKQDILDAIKFAAEALRADVVRVWPTSESFF
ncbi:MAG: DUF433 domain-containing protein [Blastocatellia bacterium]|jgi:uncharacterized protein (DUF433 family)|nr:DUF433 domain-containing protein [Blastocatellia bacterium]MBK6425431.1 DUF433 domain-containing protein [Blastocatellia bacterium]